MLTTWQHHFIDIPDRRAARLFCALAVLAKGELPFAGFRLTTDPKARRLACFYALGAALALAGAAVGALLSPFSLILLWPALALAIVAFAYAGAGPRVFQKAADGSVSLASRILLLPYRLAARINLWAWTRKLPPQVAITDGVFLGRFPTSGEANGFATVIDLAAELERPRGVASRWISFAMLDLVAPACRPLDRAVAAIEAARKHGTVVCCALGFQRSALSLAEWLVHRPLAHTGAGAEIARRVGSAGASSYRVDVNRGNKASTTLDRQGQSFEAFAAALMNRGGVAGKLVRRLPWLAAPVTGRWPRRRRRQYRCSVHDG